MRPMMAKFCAAAILPATALLGQSDFGMERLAAGKEAFVQKWFAEAVEDFRVAGFALLDEPPRLLECLVRQAVAQSAGGHAVQDRKATVDRFLEVERRFPIFPDLDLEPEIRRTFQTILSRDVPAESLASLPELGIASASAEVGRRAVSPPPSPPSGAGQRSETLLAGGTTSTPAGSTGPLATATAALTGTPMPTNIAVQLTATEI